jgi:hypothetical protein
MQLITSWAFSAIIAISASPAPTGLYRSPSSAHEVVLARNYGAPNNTADDASNNPPEKATNNAADDAPSDAANNAAATAAQPPNIDDAAVFPNQGQDGVPEPGLQPLRDGSVVPLTPGNDPSAAPAAPPEDGSIGFPDSAAALTAKFPNESGTSGAAFPNAAKDGSASFETPSGQSDPFDEYAGMAKETIRSPQTPGELDPAQELPKNLQQVPADDGGNSSDPQETSLDRGYDETSAASAPSRNGPAQKRQPPIDRHDKAAAMEGSLPQDLSQPYQPSSGDDLEATDSAAPSLQDTPYGEQPSLSDDIGQETPATENGDK